MLTILAAEAQTRVAADVTIQQAHKGKSVRVEKQVYYNANGSLVVHFTYPTQYYVITNRLGETSVYQPQTNEVMQMNDASVSSEDEMIALFMTPNYTDLGLQQLGFVLNKVERKGGDQIGTYVPTGNNSRDISRAVVVCREGNPIYCAFYDHDGLMTRKTYYSRYTEFRTFTMPTLVTQIAYNGLGDSVIKREEYRNIRTEGFGSESLFDFTIPNNAKRVSPKTR